MTIAAHFTDRVRRGLATAAIAAGGLAIHLAIQRAAPPPLWRAPESLVGLTPFLPWSIWIYLLFFPFLVATGALVPRDRWTRLLLAWTLASVASWTLILLAPITFVRPDPAALDPLHAWALGRVYGIDAAHVTFPCLHSAVTWIGWHFLRDVRPRLRGWLFAFAAAITLSTMTARQHLITDNVAGLVIAWACARTVTPVPAPRHRAHGTRAPARDQSEERGPPAGSRS